MRYNKLLQVAGATLIALAPVAFLAFDHGSVWRHSAGSGNPRA
jgi:hypothetical protein